MMKWLDNFLKSWLNIFKKEWGVELILVDCVDRKHIRYVVKSVNCEAKFIGNDAVAQANGLMKELLIEINYNQSARQWVFRIEQTHIDFAT